MTATTGAVAGEDAAATSVALDVPADVSFVGVVRTLTAGLGARCSLTIDEIDDLRIAVDEACTLLLTLAVEGSTLQAGFDLTEDSLTVAVDVAARDGAELDRGGFGWTVLESLAEITEVRDDAGTLGITLHKVAEEVVSAPGDAATP